MLEVTPQYLSRSISSYNRYIHEKEFKIIETDDLIKPKAPFFQFKQYINGVNECYIVQDILVKPENSTSSVNLNNIAIHNGGLIFYNCTFNCDITINLNQCKNIAFINCSLNNNFSFNSKIAGNLFIFNTTISGDTKFEKNSEVNSSIIFEESTFSDVKFIENFKANELIIHNQTKIKQGISFENTSINTIKVVNDVDIRGDFNKYWNISYQQPAKNATIFISTTTIGGYLNLFGYHLEQVLIEQVIIGDKISFTSCKIKNIVIKGENGFNHFHIGAEINDFKIDKTTINGQISIDIDSKIGFLNISSSTLRNDFYAEKSKIELIKIEQNSELQALRVGSSEIANIDFQNSKFHGWLAINSTLNQNLTITNCLIYNNFHFLSKNEDLLKTTFINLTNTFIKGSCTIERVNCAGIKIERLVCKNLDLVEINDNGYFLASEILCVDYLKISRKSNYKSLSFSKLYTPFLTLENISIETNKVILSNSHLDKLTHYDLTKFEYLFENSKINQIYFTEKTNPKDCIYTFINCEFSLLKISNFNNLGNLFFRTIKAKSRNQALSNYQTLLLEQIRENGIEDFKIQEEYHKYLNWNSDFSPNKPSVIFSQSSLGKAEFTDFDFESFEFYYNNSKITETFISGGTLPQTIEISNVEKDKNPTDYYIQKVGAYNQFKKIFDSQGDNFQSTYFQAKAAENQSLLLSEQKKEEISQKQETTKIWLQRQWFSFHYSYFSHNAFERLTFRLNECSNKHGESWVQALKFIFFVSLLFFILYCLSSDEYELTNNFNWRSFDKIFKDYILFLNPTEKIKSDLNGSSTFIVFVSKIFIGYGIFQLIAAFRKHGKKSG